MGSIVAMRPTGALTRRDPRRLDLFRRTVGKELVGAEIDEAIEWCEIYGANPFVKDIYFFVFGKFGADDRRVVPVLSIGMYRKIASRTGDYRPDDRPPRLTYDAAAKGPDNPAGIVDCEVTVHKYVHGAWHPVTERVRWEERAPIVEQGSGGIKWEDTGEVWPDSGKPKRRKVQVGEIVRMLDPKKKNWATMPETMLAKCVEAAAIRKAWPNETGGSYVEGELDAAQTIEGTATEIAESYAAEQRLKQVGAANSILIDWMDGQPLAQVPVGQLGDRAIDWVRRNAAEPLTVKLWTDRNQHALREFWGRDKAAALAVKAAIEPVLATAPQAAE